MAESDVSAGDTGRFWVQVGSRGFKVPSGGPTEVSACLLYLRNHGPKAHKHSEDPHFTPRQSDVS
jgi:hypothetical protein